MKNENIEGLDIILEQGVVIDEVTVIGHSQKETARYSILFPTKIEKNMQLQAMNLYG